MSSALSPSTAQTKDDQSSAVSIAEPPRISDIAGVFVFVLLTFSFSLGSAPLSGTEGHRAITAHQMVQSGRYLVPTLYGYTYLKKPPLHYWILAGFEKVFGASEWVWRLPSVIGAAALASFIYLMSARWFGRIGGLASALSFVCLVSLWSQTRSADIDSLNTFFTVGAGLCIVELGLSRARTWIAIVGGIALGAALLLKGPACLPVVVGAIVGPIIANRSWRIVRRPTFYALLVIGAALFTLWYLGARSAIQSNNIAIDTGGIEEAKRRMLLDFSDVAQIGKALVLPPLLLIYGLPSVLALVILPLRRQIDPNHRAIVVSLTATFCAALAIGFFAGMTNARYAYPAVPMICPLAGALVVAWRDKRLADTTRQALLGALGIVVVVLAAATIVLASLCYATFRDVNVACILCSVLAVPTGIWALMQSWRGRAAPVSVGLIVVLAFGICSFAEYKNLERSNRSAYAAAQVLKQAVGEGTTVTTWYTLWAQPELFYYANVNVVPKNMDDSARFGTTTGWVVFYDVEWNGWPSKAPERFSKPIVLNIDPRTRRIGGHPAVLVKVLTP